MKEVRCELSPDAGTHEFTVLEVKWCPGMAALTVIATKGSLGELEGSFEDRKCPGIVLSGEEGKDSFFLLFPEYENWCVFSAQNRRGAVHVCLIRR